MSVAYLSKRTLLIVIALAVLCLAVRVPHLQDLPHDDLVYYTSWTMRMLQGGLGNAYGKGGVHVPIGNRDVRLPPCNNGTLHCALFYAVGRYLYPAVAGRPLDVETAVLVRESPDTPTKRITRVLYKLPAIFADVLTCVLIAGWVSSRFGTLKGAVVGACYAVHPAVIHNSAVWGQIDSWHTLCLTASLMALLRQRYFAATAAFTLAMLFKLQAMALLPVVGVCVLFGPMRKKPTRREEVHRPAVDAAEGSDIHARRAWQGAGLSLLIVAVCWAPWLLTGAGRHILDPYLRTVGQYRYTTVNAFNVYWLMEDWDRTRPIDFTQATDDRAAAVSLGGAAVSYRTLGLAGVLATTMWMCRRLRRNGCGRRAIELSSLYVCLAMFLFATEMHERYLYPAVALWAAAYRPSWRWWCVWALVGAATTVNMACFHSADPASILGRITEWTRRDVVLAGNVTALSLLGLFLYVAGELWRLRPAGVAAGFAEFDGEEHRETPGATVLVSNVHASEV